ncbi:MAG: aldo/keto reductase [Kofleriaceae bacterium]
MPRAIGLGCMRLSTEPARPDEATSRAIIDAAIAAGITLVDTADVYCHSDADLGHNERLLANLPPHVRIVTKGGLTRPDGAWVPDGRAKHLASAARASLARLGRIDLYLLHVIDPEVPLATSVRALARLRDDEVVPAIGLSNVNLTQLESALSIAPIAAVEIELHPYKLDALRGGLLDACTSRGIEILAYRPFGGRRGVSRLARDPIVRAHATRLACTPAELILAWLRSLSPMVIPLPGASRRETALSAATVIELDDDAKRALDDAFVTVTRRAAPAHGDRPLQPAMLSSPRTSEVVIVMGIPGAGKSSLARQLVERGYTRLNRDDRGGSLLELARELDAALASGARCAVLDNTYASRASRRPVIDIARRHGLAVRCVVVDTPIERAQHNAVLRMLDRHERLLEPAELRGTDIGPGAQFRWRREYEPPREDEGFDEIAIVPFADLAREHAPRSVASGDGHPAILVELDDIVWRGRPRTVDKIALHDGARDALRAWHAAGHVIAATSWQPGVAPTRFADLVEQLARALDVPLRAMACFHPAGPPVCWCRKPLPGLALAMARQHRLRFEVCVGGGAADKGFALRAGISYRDARDGWPHPDT